MSKPAVLLLEDGSEFHGAALGHDGAASGVMVCYAGASGFPELMTDPAYRGKMLCFTYPHVGNPGVNPDDLQSDRVHVHGVAMREISRIKANRLGKETMNEFLRRNGVPGVEGIDTRKLTRTLAEKGPLAAAIGTGVHADAKALVKLLAVGRATGPMNRDFAVRNERRWHETGAAVPAAGGPRVVVYDFGVKRGFVRRLAEAGCAVRLAPSDFPAADAVRDDVDGVVFSSGPGLPENEAAAVETAKAILGKKPLWGVGLGAGIVAAAAGAKTHADGRGHYGHQSVGRAGGPNGEMAMLCVDFRMDGDSLGAAGLDPTHIHLNDKSIVGFASAGLRAMGCLFHPESEPGPRDSLYMFGRFIDMMRA